MQKTNIFDDVMDFIDKNAKDSYSAIKRGVYAVSTYTDMDFNKFLAVLTKGKTTLRDYFTKRKVYFAVRELVDYPEKPIIEIALEYGYSEQSAFNRAVKRQYNHTPNEIRKEKLKFADERMHFSDFVSNENEYGKRLQEVIEIMFDSDCNYVVDMDYFECFINATDEYGFDTATCKAISEVSERIGVPFGMLLEVCYETMIDIHSSPDYIDPRIEKAIDCGIKSDEELDKICEYYNCKYYHLDRYMVELYREKNYKSE